MNIHDLNKAAWDKAVEEGENPYTKVVSSEQIKAARAGRWALYLSDCKPVPSSWFPPLKHARVLCLASGGGQQAPIFAALGAEVTLLDSSPNQLAQDRYVAQRDGLTIHTLEGDMADLSALHTDYFDLIFNPVSTLFVPGHKLLFEDGIFCEFAVFELHELEHIPFSRGRIVWKRPCIEDSIAVPALKNSSSPKPNVEWQVGEALTNLLIGLKRYRRGEKLSGSRFVQNHALDRVLDLAEWVEAETPYFKDPFGIERCFGRRFPAVSERLSHFAQGYERTPESSLAILEFLEQHFEVNAAIAREIRAFVHEDTRDQV